MDTVEFTEYVLPNGAKRPYTIDVPDEVAARAREIKARGFHFDIEILMTGHISMTIESNDDDVLDEEGAVAHRIVPNGPEVYTAVLALVDDAWSSIATRN